MANIIIINVVCANAKSGLFMAVVDNGKLNIVKSWGKASYPVPASIVMDKDTDCLAMFKASGIPCVDFKSALDYPNNCFADDKEMGKLTALVCGKSTHQPVTQAVTPSPMLELESHEGLVIPSVLADTWEKHNANLVNYKDLRRVALDAGMPDRLTAPNPVKKWISEKLASEGASTVAPVAQAVQPATTPAVDMALFQAFQAFMATQGK